MNLRIKINLAILLTFVIIALVYTVILFPFELQRQQTVIEQVKLTLRTIIAQRQEQFADEIFRRQHEAIKITIDELLKVKGIATIRVYLADGSLFASSDENTKLSLAQPQLEELTATPRFIRKTIAGKPLLNLAYSIEVIGEHVGFIEVDYDLSSVEEEVRTLKMITMAMLATILLAMFGLLNLLLSKMVLKPIYSLSETIKKIQNGALGEQVRLHTHDEMGSMATAFNEMSVELAELNHGLEKRVDERTRQLFKTNRELEEARLIAESSIEQKSEFLANMSHEIRSPMNAIIGLSYLALKIELSPKLRDYLEKIESSSKTLLGIINDILDFSKIEAGKLSLENIPFQLDDVLDNLCSMVAIKAEERGVELILHTGKGVPNQLVGDPLRLGQVLLNLSTNAIKFTDQGHVLIKIERLDEEKSEMLRFSVIDTGIGLSEFQITKLFQSFSQADNSTTRKYGGTGLGLSICKNIVELMGSTIEVESVVGKGSTFSFSTNFKVDNNVAAIVLNNIYGDRVTGKKVLVVDDNARRKQQQVEGLAAIQGARALVVEDNDINQQVAAELLIDAGLEVEIEENGLLALERITSESDPKRFDIVFMDIQMPVMDGHTATRMIRAAGAPLSNIPIVAMTAHAMESERRKCLENGMNDHLPKPIDPELLQKTLVQWIEPRQHQPAKSSAGVNKKEGAGDEDLLPEELPEFDLSAGLARVAGEKKLYRELLLKFARNHHQSTKRMNELLDQQGYQQGQYLAHAIKGNAGNLGAMGLYTAAAQVEQAFLAVDRIKPILKIFDDELQAVLASLATLPQDQERIESGEVHKRKKFDLHQVNDIIELLQQQISSDYGEALKLISTLQSMLAGSKITEQVGNLAEYLGDFDEEGAKKELLVIRQLLNSEEEGSEGG